VPHIDRFLLILLPTWLDSFPFELLAAEGARIFCRILDAKVAGVALLDVIGDIKKQERVITQQ